MATSSAIQAHAPFRRLAPVAAHAILLLGAATMIIPFLWMISTSFKPDTEVLLWPPNLIPMHPTGQAYGRVFAAAPFLRYFANSMVVSLASTATVVLTSVLAGFIFAKYTFPLKNILFGVILATAIFPFETYMLPLYDMMAKQHWLNTYQAMALPYLIMSFGVFMLRQNIASSIPNELLDAARIDGCGEWQILGQVVIPLSVSAMSALGIFAFIQAWSAFLWPLLIVGRREMFNMELGLSAFQHRFSVDYNLLMAGSVMSVLPMIVVFVLLRRQIVEGITLTGLKG